MGTRRLTQAPAYGVTAEVAQLGRALDRADRIIVLTAEYNHGYPAVLKNAMDWTFPEWQRKPIAFVGWGNVGGARAIEQLRLVAVEFEMAPLRQPCSRWSRPWPANPSPNPCAAPASAPRPTAARPGSSPDDKRRLAARRAADHLHQGNGPA